MTLRTMTLNNDIVERKFVLALRYNIEHRQTRTHAPNYENISMGSKHKEL